MLDIRKFSFSVSLPTIIILVAWYAQSLSLNLPAIIKPVAQLLPYVFIISAMTLAWVFHHSREFHILLISAATYWALQNINIISNNHSYNISLLYNLICVLVPLNIAIISVLSERGIINFHGLKRIAILILQAMLVYWLSQADTGLLNQLLQVKFYSHPLIDRSSIPQLAQVIFLLSMVSLGIHVLKKTGLLLAARISVLICLWFALEGFSLNTTNHAMTTLIWFTAIGIILLVAMILNSKQLAYLDELTNLPSRRALNQYLATLGKNYSIAMVDIDHFKRVNDRHGHDIGDQVLKMMATHLRKVHGGGRAFRYGGEEFTIVFPGKDAHEAAIYTDNMREAISSSPFTIRHKHRPKQKPEKPKKRTPIKELKVTISIGLAQRSDLLLTTEEVVKAADQNLYKAKKKGRNQVVV